MCIISIDFLGTIEHSDNNSTFVTMQTDSHQVLSKIMQQLVSAGPPKLVYTAHTQMHAPRDAQQFPLPRIMMPLSGSHRFTCSDRLDKQSVAVTEHQAVFTAPMAWTKSQHQANTSFFALVCHHGFTRYLTFSTNNKGVAIPNSKYWIHTKLETSNALRSSLLAMHNTAKRTDCKANNLCLRHQLFSCLLLAHDDLLKDKEHDSDQAHSQWRHACAWIDENCHQDINRDELATFLTVHPNHIARIFRHNNDRFPQRLEQARMARASTLLSQSLSSISDIAISSGFQSPSYFIRRFKLIHGITPKKMASNS